MKTALIMGISGGFGGHVAQSLARNGWKIKIMIRNPDKLPEQFKGAEIIKGEVANQADIRKATEAVDVIVYGVNPPNYAWEGVALPLLDNVAQVAEEKKLSIVFPANVYIYNPDDGPEFSEQSAADPQTSRGKIRFAMEQRLKKAAENGAKVIVLRMGDFIGKAAKSTWLAQMIKKTGGSYVLTSPGHEDIKHSWAYLPDVATTVAKLLNVKDEMAAYSAFNFKGYQLSPGDIAAVIEQVTAKPVVIKKFPWLLFKLFSVFSQLFKGLVEMRYLWSCEMNMTESKLQKTLKGRVAYTIFNVALIESELLK